jgi:hypothetical protein
MKLIIAYIQPHKLNDVKQALYKQEVYKMSVTNSLGCGQQKGYQESYRGVGIEVNLLKERSVPLLKGQRPGRLATARYSCWTFPNVSVSAQANAEERP